MDGYSIIEIETVILFKIKAWLDIKKRKEAGEKVDSKNIRKHKNDIFRLLSNVVPSSKVETAGEIQKDIIEFTELILKDKPDLKNLEIKRYCLGKNSATISIFWVFAVQRAISVPGI